jgi:cyanophycin synthetase
MIFQLTQVHKTRLGSTFGVPGATAVMDIVVQVPDAFDLATLDRELDAVLGFTATINTDDTALKILHRGLGLSSFVQGMNRIVVSNQYRVLGQRTLEDNSTAFFVVISLASAEATMIGFDFVEQVLESFANNDTDIEHLIDSACKRLDPLGEPGQNQGFMVTMAMKHNIPVRRIWAGTHVFGTGSYAKRLSSTMTPYTTAQGVVYAKNKRSTADLLRKSGLPGAEHVTAKTWEETLAAAHEFGYPVVVKPYDRDNGQGVYAGITTDQDLKLAYTKVTEIVPEFLVERHFEGTGHRFTIHNNQVITVTQKHPATVTGDGVSTVEYLITNHQSEARRIKRPDGDEPFVVIGINHVQMTIDAEVKGMLVQQNVALGSVLEPGQSIQLRRRNNASAGGLTRAIDQSTVHPDNKALCLRAARILDLDIAGVDLITPDVTRSWLEVGALICEVNAIPQIGYNHGIEPMMLGLFKSGSRIPVTLAIVDQELDPPLFHELASVFNCNGISTQTGMWINGLCVSQSWLNSFDPAVALIFDREVDSALCVMTKADVVEHGLPLDCFDQILIENPDDVALLAEAHSKNITPLKVNRNE